MKISEKNRRGCNVLLIGYGSIGKRHARNLVEIGIKPYILTKHPDDLHAHFISDIQEVVDKAIEYCIIASPTARHLTDLKSLTILKNIPKHILIEKPVERTFRKGMDVATFAKKHMLNLFIAYNLRFLLAFDKIRTFIEKKRKQIKLVEIVAGQDLREWRKKDYRTSYSAHRTEGGGVDLDLSHEVDYLLWLFGKSRKNTIYRDHISNLEIDSPDVFKLISTYDSFVAEVTLDYIRKPKTRYLKIFCEDGENLYYDLTTNTLEIGADKTVITGKITDSYKTMLCAFLGIEKNQAHKLCTMKEGLDVLKTIKV